jgi:hypothetical protein
MKILIVKKAEKIVRPGYCPVYVDGINAAKK